MVLGLDILLLLLHVVLRSFQWFAGMPAHITEGIDVLATRWSPLLTICTDTREANAGTNHISMRLNALCRHSVEYIETSSTAIASSLIRAATMKLLKWAQAKITVF